MTEMPSPAKGGILETLRIDQLKASPNNPRRLFDPEPLAALKASIHTHGVLVPLTVFKLPGQEKYGIIDGERRFRCLSRIGRGESCHRYSSEHCVPAKRYG